MSEGTYSVIGPVMATYIPLTESNDGAAGDDPATYSDGKHQHPRMSSSTPITLDPNGQGVATFSRSFASEPLPAFAQMPPLGSGPCIFLVESWITTGPNYTGANVRGYRLSGPQNLASVTILGISAAVGGQTITTYGPANGVKVSVIMLPNSGS